jgi:Glycosyltransferase family 87
MLMKQLRQIGQAVADFKIPRLWYEAAAIAVALGIVYILIDLLVHSRNLATKSGQPVFGDYIAFWSAGRTVLEGEIAHVHERATQMRHHLEAIPDIKVHAPFNSPPTLLLLTPLMALPPYPVSAMIFLALSFGFYLFAATKILPDKRALIFAVTAPAVVYQFGSVQLALLIAASSGLALLWLDRRPRLAGALVAVLAIKPHLAVLWPLLLALSGRWRAFWAAAIATIAFVLLAGFVFGFEVYARFLASLPNSARVVAEQRVVTPAYASVYANLLQWHAPQALAVAAHALSACAALGVALIVFKRGERGAQGAALCAATLLISPYLFFYDFILLAAGAALLGAPRNRLETLAMIFAWGAGLSLTLGYFLPKSHLFEFGLFSVTWPGIRPPPICPVAAWLLLIAALRRVGAGAPALRG